MKRLKDVNINDKELQGEELVFKALLDRVETAKTKNGNDYLILEIEDQGVKETIRIFDLKDVYLEVGRVYAFKCTVGEYNGKPQFKYVDYRDSVGDPTDYLNKVENIRLYAEFIGHSIAYMAEPLKTIVKNLYIKYQEEFLVYPAARSMHHDLIGGLAMHTGTMLMNAQDLQKRYEYLNLDLINAIIVLHDLGKIREYKMYTNGSVEYSVEGSMLGHITLILGEVELEHSKLNNLTPQDESLILALKNGVASHHGRLEWGSPVKPATGEARLVHHLDMIDADMYKSSRELSNMKSGEVNVNFDNRYEFDTHYKI